MKKRILLVASVLLCLSFPAVADIGKTWTASGAAQFAQGKLEGTSVRSTGELELAPETVKLEGLEAEYVWDVEAGPDGTVYVATGSPAAVYAFREGKLELLFKTEEKHVLSLLPLRDGSVLAATAPQGIVFRVPRRGKATTFADLEDPYVWDMELGRHNQVYCATGPNGRLMELSPEGKAREVLKVKQKNFVCVAVDKDGTAYAGTDTDGYIYAVAPNGRASVVYDADESEVHDIALDGEGALYACTAQGEPSGPPSGPPPVPMPGPSRGGAAQESGGEGAGPSGVRQPGAFNSVYRIVPNKGGFLVGRFDETFTFCLALAEGRILVGTGTYGRLLSLGRDMQYTILTQFDAAFVWTMALLPGGDAIAGTSHPGSLRLVKAGYRDTGTYLSKPFDAGYVSRWGNVRWTQRAAEGQSIRIKLRTGNSGEPDERWSDWSEWVTDPAGQAVSVPMGRFAQFEAELGRRGKPDSPILLAVDVSYRQANARPVIEDLSVDGASVVGKEERGGRPSGERTPPRGGSPPQGQPQRPERAPTAQKTIAWKVSDPNEDDMTLSLYYRGVHETDWKKIKENLRDETSYAWDTLRVADGYHLLKLIASDSPARPKEDALENEKVSGPLLVDNTAPAVADLTSRRQPDGSYELAAVAQDALSAITKMEVSHNGEDWETVFPADGILDSPREPFSYATDVLPPGEHVFVFAATDGSGNVGSAKTVVTVQAPGR